MRKAKERLAVLRKSMEEKRAELADVRKRMEETAPSPEPEPEPYSTNREERKRDLELRHEKALNQKQLLERDIKAEQDNIKYFNPIVTTGSETASKQQRSEQEKQDSGSMYRDELYEIWDESEKGEGGKELRGRAAEEMRKAKNRLDYLRKEREENERVLKETAPEPEPDSTNVEARVMANRKRAEINAKAISMRKGIGSSQKTRGGVGREITRQGVITGGIDFSTVSPEELEELRAARSEASKMTLEQAGKAQQGMYGGVVSQRFGRQSKEMEKQASMSQQAQYLSAMSTQGAEVYGANTGDDGAESILQEMNTRLANIQSILQTGVPLHV